MNPFLCFGLTPESDYQLISSSLAITYKCTRLRQLQQQQNSQTCQLGSETMGFVMNSKEPIK